MPGSTSRTSTSGGPAFQSSQSVKSKTYLGGAGQFVGEAAQTIPCAVAAVEAWLANGEQDDGPLFCSFSPHGESWAKRGSKGRLVAEVEKRLFHDADAPPGDVDAIGPRGLRRGFMTSADMADAAIAQIMDVTLGGHALARARAGL